MAAEQGALAARATSNSSPTGGSAATASGSCRLVEAWAGAGGRGRRLIVQPPYGLRDPGGRARYLADLTGRVAGWDRPLQVWHGPPAAADYIAPAGTGEAAELTRTLAAASHPRTTLLIPAAAAVRDTGNSTQRSGADDSSAPTPAVGDPDGGWAENRDHLAVDGELAAVWAVTGWPGAMTPGWASSLTALAHHVALHTRPVDLPTAQRLLRRRLSALASTRLLDERTGRLEDPQLTVAVQAATDLREGLARGSTRLLHAQLLLVLVDPDPLALAAAGKALADTARALLADVGPLTFQHAPGWAAARPGGVPLRWPWRLLDAASLAATIPLPVGPPAPRRTRNATGRPAPAGVLVGADPESGVPLLVDRWSAHNPARLVVGTSGAGKSYAAKLELLRQHVTGTRAVIIDPEGEFGPVTQTLGGLHLQVGEEPVGLDPVGLATRPRIPAAEGLAVLTSWAGALLGGGLSAVDVALLDRALAVLRADQPATPPAAVGASAGDLLSVITDLAAHPPYKGADLPARLSPAANGSVAALFAPNPALANPPSVVCFDLRAVATRVRPAVMAAVLGWTWAQTITAQVATRTLLVVDEAHLLLDDPPAADLLAQFARRARKYAVGLDVVTQRLSDFLAHPAGQAVLANTATKLLLGCEDHERAAVTAGLGLTTAEAGWLQPGSRGRGLLVGTGLRSPVRIVAGPAEHRLASAPPRR